MNLPLIIEVAIGLVFIYLTLSLLASEIQELIGTVLQWRAEHLKQSIEVLLAGDAKEYQDQARALANQLYENPLIRNLNQEATGRITRSFRSIVHAIGQAYRWITRSRNVFGNQTSGPSYIPSESFAASLLRNLEFENLNQTFINARLGQFIEERIRVPAYHILNDLKASTANEYLLDPELRQFEQNLGQIYEDFRSHRIDITQTLERLLEALDIFTHMAEDVLPENHHLSTTFLRRMTYLRRTLGTVEAEKLALIRKLQPTIQEVVSVFDGQGDAYDELVAILKREGGGRITLLDKINPENIPPKLLESLALLARQAEDKVRGVTGDKVQSVGLEALQLQREVEDWFNRSMERATGVYKRNAKAVAILIGLGIAIFLNADSLHILERLNTDPILRASITQVATQTVENAGDDPAQDLAALQDLVHETLEQFPIPIGYNEVILQQQRAANKHWPLPFPRQWLGWLITGIAISMGANFWYGLLQKVVSVKNTGKDPRN